MPLHDKWPPEKKLEVVRGVDDNVSSWLKDHDYYKKYYLSAPPRERQTEPKSTKHDQTVAIMVANMIASQRTPYKNWGEFDRDSCLKNFRTQAIILEDEGMIAQAEELMNHQESDYAAMMRKRNKEFLQNQADGLENANKVSEIQKVLGLCQRQMRYMEGKQLKELQDIIRRCEEALS